ncbi:MAG TPA: LysE family transporter, partial [Bacteroidia bacterium]|nr:LysE family transporter [Bacteroidia bacterium]
MALAFFYGMLTGAVMSVMLGTVFFALVQNSIDHGVRAGIFIASGVILSDCILITASWFNAEIFPEGGKTEMIVRICGATFLLVYGIMNIVRRKTLDFPETERKKVPMYMLMGFALNILNPGNYIGWLAVTTNIKTVVGYTSGTAAFYYAGALCAIFGMEMLISFGASFLKKFITRRFLIWVDRTVGA